VRAITPEEQSQAMLVEVAIGHEDGAAFSRGVTIDAAARLQLAPGGAVLALVKLVSVEILDATPLPR
jgi:hypothetical protein